MTKPTPQWEEEFDKLFEEPPIWPVSSDYDNGYLEGYKHGRGLSKMELRPFVREQIEKARKEGFREGQNSVHIEAQQTDGVVKLNVDYAENAAQTFINKSQDEWHEMGYKAGLQRAIELVPEVAVAFRKMDFKEQVKANFFEQGYSEFRYRLLEKLKKEMEK